MNFEILAFYEIERYDEKGYISGTLTVRLLDINCVIRGIFFLKNPARSLLRMPQRGYVDENGQKKTYPVFVLEDWEKNHELMDAIKKKAVDFVENHIKSVPQKPKTEQQQQKISQPEKPDNSKARSAPVAKSKIVEWKDMPKKTNFANKVLK